MVKLANPSPQLCTDFKLHSYFTRAMLDWHPHALFSKHRMKGEDLFEALTQNATPCGMGALHHEPKVQLKLEFAKAIGDKDSCYFDYWNGIRMKTHIKKDYAVTAEDDAYRIEPRRYDAANPAPSFLTRTMRMLQLK